MILFGYISSLAVAIVLVVFYIGNLTHQAFTALKSKPLHNAIFWGKATTPYNNTPCAPSTYIAFSAKKEIVSKAITYTNAAQHTAAIHYHCGISTTLYYSTNNATPPLPLYASAARFLRPPPLV